MLQRSSFAKNIWAISKSFCKKENLETKRVSTIRPVNYKGGGIERTQQAGKRISVAREHSNLPDYMIDMLYDEVIRLTYYFDYKSCNSHRLDAILSYYKVGYERNFNQLWIDPMQNYFKKSDLPNKDEFELPAMKSIVSMQEEKWIFGEKRIFEYLKEKRIIDSLPHRSHSVWEKQGIEFIKQNITPHLEEIFKAVVLQIDWMTSINPENMKFQSKNYLGIRLFNHLLGKSFKIIWDGIFQKGRTDSQESVHLFLNGVREFGERIGDKHYHGGESPDEADFELYGELRGRLYSNQFKTYANKNFPAKVKGWLLRMNNACKYEQRFYSG